MTDKIEILREAIKEANRFIDRAYEAMDRLRDDKFASISGCKEVAAAKRASMDLTRVLVKVRGRRI